MFLLEEKTSPNGRLAAEIYMRDDGLFEGRIYGSESEQPDNLGLRSGFQVCGVTETLPRLEMIVDEELGL